MYAPFNVIFCSFFPQTMANLALHLLYYAISKLPQKFQECQMIGGILVKQTDTQACLVMVGWMER